MTTRELSSPGLTVMHTRLVPLLWATIGTPAFAGLAYHFGGTVALLLVVTWGGLTLRFLTTARQLSHVVLTGPGELRAVSGLRRRRSEVPLAAIRRVSEGRAPGGGCVITLFLEPTLTSGLARLSFIPVKGTYTVRRNPLAAELRELATRAGARIV